MHCVELASFDVVHRKLGWPWLAIDPTQARFAFASSDDRIATRLFAEGRVSDGPSFALPADLSLTTELRAFAIDPRGELVAIVGANDVVTLASSGELARSTMAHLAGEGFVAKAVSFDRTGARLWISAENGHETAIVSLDARTHAVFGVARSAAFPPDAFHDLRIHSQDDAVLLLAACGQDGTFARVAGWSDGPPVAIPTKLDAGAQPAGFVGFSEDGARVHLAADYTLETYAWPTLEHLSSAPFEDVFASSYSGVVLGGSIYVDGEIEIGDVGDDAVMRFDRAALTGSIEKPPVPRGMWVGRLGPNAVLTVESKGDPARGRVVAIRNLAN